MTQKDARERAWNERAARFASSRGAPACELGVGSPMLFGRGGWDTCVASSLGVLAQIDEFLRASEDAEADIASCRLWGRERLLAATCGLHLETVDPVDMAGGPLPTPPPQSGARTFGRRPRNRTARGDAVSMAELGQMSAATPGYHEATRLAIWNTCGTRSALDLDPDDTVSSVCRFTSGA